MIRTRGTIGVLARLEWTLSACLKSWVSVIATVAWFWQSRAQNAFTTAEYSPKILSTETWVLDVSDSRREDKKAYYAGIRKQSPRTLLYTDETQAFSPLDR